MVREELLQRIEDAEMILVGLGEDFDRRQELMKNENYVKGCEFLAEKQAHFLIPAWNAFCMKKIEIASGKQELLKLADLLKDKNYFVVSVATNHVIGEIPWKHDRVVMPCGSGTAKQCTKAECGEVMSLNESDEKNLKVFFEDLYEGVSELDISPLLGTCPECGAPMCLNNIYAEQYNETGYLGRWSTYMKWLQGTVNRKVLILELGVGMKFPSVIRWPFEKVAFFNQKAYFCRVHDKLYQLTPELSEKGCGISKNAIEWLHML